MSTPRILIIENQWNQFFEIHEHLSDNQYEPYPLRDSDDFIQFIDRVRVWINRKYPDSIRNHAFDYIEKFMIQHRIELVLMDYILGGPYHCLKGIDLAFEINQKRKPGEYLPVIFLSKTEHTKRNRVEQFEKYEQKYTMAKWVHKGFFGEEILEKEYFKERVISEIIDLLSIAEGKRVEMICEIKRENVIKILNKYKPTTVNSASDPTALETFTLTEELIEKIKAESIDVMKIEESQLESSASDRRSYLLKLKSILG